MIKKSPVLLFGLLLGSLSLPLVAAPNPAVVPVIRNTWLDQHNKLNAIAAGGGVDVMFLGDSITGGWQSRGKEVWARYYSGLEAATFGIGGDRTENVLWRLQNGNLDGITPKVVVLLIGTNNTGRDSAVQIAEGVTAVVHEIQKRSPASRGLLTGVFPRGEEPDTPVRRKIAEVNTIIAKLDDGQRVHFLDIGEKLLQPDGKIGRQMMPDFLHPGEDGYYIWAQAMQPLLDKLLK